MTTTDRRDATEHGDLAYVEQHPSRVYVDRTDADDAQFADELARLNRLDVADESAEERVARAIAAEVLGFVPGSWAWRQDGDHYRRMARAAIDALKPAPGTDTSTEDALHRVLDLADEWESDAALADDAEPATRDDLSRMISASRWGRQHAAEVRDAIAGPQRGHDEEGS